MLWLCPYSEGEEWYDQLAMPAMATVERVATHSASLIGASLCFTVYQVPSYLLSEHHTAIAISQRKTPRLRFPAPLQPPWAREDPKGTPSMACLLGGRVESGCEALTPAYESGQKFVFGSAATCLLHLAGRFQEERNCRVVWRWAQCRPDSSHSPEILMWGFLCYTAGTALFISPVKELRPRQGQGATDSFKVS